MDNIVFHSPSMDIHRQCLPAVLERFCLAGLTLNVRKCQFKVDSVEFFGHHVSASGFTPLQSNVAAVLSIPDPKSPKDVASFLGITNFYACFLPNNSTVSAPLRRLLKKHTPGMWTNAEELAFQPLNDLITTPSVLAHFAVGADTFVTCDASGTAVGAVLSQVSANGERPVAFASKPLWERECRYSESEREALACVFACEHWDIYLCGRPFII